MSYVKKRLTALFAAATLALLVGILFVPMAFAATPAPTYMGEASDTQVPAASHRLIVELDSAPLAIWAQSELSAQSVGGRLDVNSPAAQSYVAQLQSEQQAFINTMQANVPGAQVSSFINELGQPEANQYQITFNGMAVDPGSMDTKAATIALLSLPGVKAVHADYARSPMMYTSTQLINAPAVWNVVGGQEMGGKGVKVASMDGGVHKDAAMFSGTGWNYPAGYPVNGYGLTSNNNGKIIVSRAYFRSWDPPSAGDENPWPGTQGTSHGVHTSGSIVGNVVTNVDYLGATIDKMSGVAPGAWIMSYRVFYNSVTNNGSFYNAEGIAALEDIVRDDADVLNNSWGGGPGSVGGVFDPLDTALLNAYRAGVFVSMSNGNAGPNYGTGDHPSAEYINVAASTTSGTFASGRFSVSAPTPVSDTLKNMPYGTAQFGNAIPIGQIATYTYTTAAAVEPANTNGCVPFTGTPFAGGAAAISRGVCNFSLKVYNAQQAGATFAVIYNNAGDGLINMAPGDFAAQVTIPSIFIGQTNGQGLLAWRAQKGAAASVTLDNSAFQAGNTPDLIASFSSRGPGVGEVLKPDVAAPGVNIMSQGYGPGTGEVRHLGFGQASGTSMASPHVAGSAALIRQVYPTWSNAAIKSALMSTSKYMDIFNQSGTPAQPLDMGAGRIDLTNVLDPGVLLAPPSVSFGSVVTGSTKSVMVTITSVASATETYTLSTLYTGGGFVTTTVMAGVSVSPAVVTLAPGASTQVQVTLDSAASMGLGHNQGYIVMTGSSHHAHMPVWGRVVPGLSGTANVLIIDNDGSSSLGHPNYASYYANAVTAAGFTYDYLNTDASAGAVANFIPDTALLTQYKAVIYFTGDNYRPNGTFTVATPLTLRDQDRLTEYANQGGILIAMGQDLAAVLASAVKDNGSFFYGAVLGGNYLRDSVSNDALPTQPIVSHGAAPTALAGVSLDLSAVLINSDKMTGMVALLGSNEVPTNTTAMSGTASLDYTISTGNLNFSVTVNVTNPVTVTAAHIHTGTAGVNGGVLYGLFSTPTYVTNTLTFTGSVVISPNLATIASGGAYINVHTSDYPGGEVRGQTSLTTVKVPDGAGNQAYVDELYHLPDSRAENPALLAPGYVPLFTYPSASNMDQGVVAMAHRDQPSLENPGTAYKGRSIYTSFGLEGVNDSKSTVSRSGLIGAFMTWAMNEPTVVISNVTPAGNSSPMTMFQANITNGIRYRWSFGDGSPILGPLASRTAGHAYAACGDYTVRVEATNNWGNVVVSSQVVSVTGCPTKPEYRLYLPGIVKN